LWTKSYCRTGSSRGKALEWTDRPGEDEKDIVLSPPSIGTHLCLPPSRENGLGHRSWPSSDDPPTLWRANIPPFGKGVCVVGREAIKQASKLRRVLYCTVLSLTGQDRKSMENDNPNTDRPTEWVSSHHITSRPVPNYLQEERGDVCITGVGEGDIPPTQPPPPRGVCFVVVC